MLRGGDVFLFFFGMRQINFIKEFCFFNESISERIDKIKLFRDARNSLRFEQIIR